MSHCLRTLIFLLFAVAISLKSGVTEAQNIKDVLWCIANEKVPADELQTALNWACVEGGADCGKIQKDGPCFLPNTLKDHASFAFNSYYQRMKHNAGICYFNETALLTNYDPSHDGCKYEYIP